MLLNNTKNLIVKYSRLSLVRTPGDRRNLYALSRKSYS